MNAATLEGMQLCAEHGHRWAWRSSWHDVGFVECWRCGTTGPVGTDRTPPAAAPPAVAPPSSRDRDNAPRRDAGATDKPRKAATRKEPGRLGRKPGSCKPERDAAILAAVAAGERPVDVAARFNLDPSRIAQIRARARREDAQRSSSCCPATFHGNVTAQRAEERRGEATPRTPLSAGEGGSARLEPQNQ
ncbi:MAG: hypothetical protein ACK52I_23500, partial [Pseudomonadota bacterium]